MCWRFVVLVFSVKCSVLCVCVECGCVCEVGAYLVALEEWQVVVKSRVKWKYNTERKSLDEHTHSYSFCGAIDKNERDRERTITEITTNKPKLLRLSGAVSL